MKLKFTAKQKKIAYILIEEIENWESTEKVSTKEFMKLVRRLSKLKLWKK